ncbi:transcriptional regulator BolA [Zophobihabitans entericus]|uniref:DNA-binding transcriptional regulator BolA n=2 Tax=Zophobihabitans entericus TaxID=1635327 RepID=A0A6G9IEV3_9GAMM|nr:transcriptional regulator BolA [Zophobihabitans entericus]QIQ22357.1 transcriptional regulator BolA [Zophobihabitans entericus]
MASTIMKQRITHKLNSHFFPVYLDIMNESGNHNVPAGSETHFKVIMVSDDFDGKRLVQRHRLVYDALAEELASTVHALALHLYTRAEWQQAQGKAPDSPACRGGGK